MSGGLTPGPAGGGGGATLSSATPQPPGTPAAGASGEASDAGHIHTPTTAAQVGLGAVTATGADAATARAAIGVDAGWVASGVAALTLVQGGSGCSASVVAGRLRATIASDARHWYGYVSGTWQTDRGPHGYLAIPAGVREVIAAFRVYTGSPAYDFRCAEVLLRNGTDPTAAPTVPTPAVAAGVKLAGQGIWGYGGGSPFGTWDGTYPPNDGLGVAFSPTPGATTRWIGVRWTPTTVQAMACDSVGTPAVGDLLTYSTSAVVPAWPAPTLAVFAFNRLDGGPSYLPSTVDLDVVVYYR